MAAGCVVVIVGCSVLSHVTGILIGCCRFWNGMVTGFGGVGKENGKEPNMVDGTGTVTVVWGSGTETAVV